MSDQSQDVLLYIHKVQRPSRATYPHEQVMARVVFCFTSLGASVFASFAKMAHHETLPSLPPLYRTVIQRILFNLTETDGGSIGCFAFFFAERVDERALGVIYRIW